MRIEICSSIGLNPLLLSELSRGNPAQAAVWPDFDVVLAPIGNALSSLGQAQEPLLVQAFISELAVETLDVAVLHRPVRLGQDVPHAMCCGPSHKGPACELWAVVCAHGQWVASEGGRLVEQACHVLPRDPVVHGNVHALVAEVIGYPSFSKISGLSSIDLVRLRGGRSVQSKEQNKEKTVPSDLQLAPV